MSSWWWVVVYSHIHVKPKLRKVRLRWGWVGVLTIPKESYHITEEIRLYPQEQWYVTLQEESNQKFHSKTFHYTHSQSLISREFIHNWNIPVWFLSINLISDNLTLLPPQHLSAPSTEWETNSHNRFHEMYWFYCKYIPWEGLLYFIKSRINIFLFVQVQGIKTSYF